MDKEARRQGPKAKAERIDQINMKRNENEKIEKNGRDRERRQSKGWE